MQKNNEKNFLHQKQKHAAVQQATTSKIKRAKGTKQCVIKGRKLNLEDHKYCFEATELENKINQLENKRKMIQKILEKIHKRNS